MPARPYEADIKFKFAFRAPKAHIYVAFFAVAGDIVAVRAAVNLIVISRAGQKVASVPLVIPRVILFAENLVTYRRRKNSIDIHAVSYGDCSPNDCAYVGQKVKPDGTLVRCKEKNTDGERSALEACPRTCGTCP